MTCFAVLCVPLTVLHKSSVLISSLHLCKVPECNEVFYPYRSRMTGGHGHQIITNQSLEGMKADLGKTDRYCVLFSLLSVLLSYDSISQLKLTDLTSDTDVKGWLL